MTDKQAIGNRIGGRTPLSDLVRCEMSRIGKKPIVLPAGVTGGVEGRVGVGEGAEGRAPEAVP